jgi:transcriptional regulator with XRE-family HTH domain
MAGMYRDVSDLHRNRRDIPVLPYYKVKFSTEKKKPKGYPKEPKSLGEQIKIKRMDQKMLQKELGKILGVSECTIFNWEKNRNQPSIKYLPKIYEFLGYQPLENTDKQDLLTKLDIIRKRLGLSLEKIANLIGFDPSTLNNWRTKKQKPSPKLLEKIETWLKINLLCIFYFS